MKNAILVTLFSSALLCLCSPASMFGGNRFVELDSVEVGLATIGSLEGSSRSVSLGFDPKPPEDGVLVIDFPNGFAPWSFQENEFLFPPPTSDEEAYRYDFDLEMGLAAGFDHEGSVVIRDLEPGGPIRRFDSEMVVSQLYFDRTQENRLLLYGQGDLDGSSVYQVCLLDLVDGAVVWRSQVDRLGSISNSTSGGVTLLMPEIGKYLSQEKGGFRRFQKLKIFDSETGTLFSEIDLEAIAESLPAIRDASVSWAAASSSRRYLAYQFSSVGILIVDLLDGDYSFYESAKNHFLADEPFSSDEELLTLLDYGYVNDELVGVVFKLLRADDASVALDLSEFWMSNPDADFSVNAISADGGTLYVAGGGGEVLRWSVGSGEALEAMDFSESRISRIVCSNEGGLIATFAVDGTVSVLDTTSGTVRATLGEQASSLSGFASSDSILFTGNWTKPRIWSFESDVTEDTALSAYPADIRFLDVGRLQVDFAADKGTVLDLDGPATYEITSNQYPYSLTVRDKSDDGSRVLIEYSTPRELVVRDRASGAILWMAPFSSSDVIGAHLSGDGSMVHYAVDAGSANVDGVGKVYHVRELVVDLVSGDSLLEIDHSLRKSIANSSMPLDMGILNGLAWSVFPSDYGDVPKEGGAVTVNSFSGPALALKIELPAFCVAGKVLEDEGGKVVALVEGSSLEVFDLRTGEFLDRVSVPADSFVNFWLDPLGEFAVLRNRDAELLFIDLESGNLLAKRKLFWSPDLSNDDRRQIRFELSPDGKQFFYKETPLVAVFDLKLGEYVPVTMELNSVVGPKVVFEEGEDSALILQRSSDLRSWINLSGEQRSAGEINLLPAEEPEFFRAFRWLR